MITCEKYVGGYYVVSALVKDNNPNGNPWGAPFFHSVRYEGYTKREAIENYRDSLTRDGLQVVREDY